MFFILSKVLAFLIAPVVWVFVLLAYSFFTKFERRAKRLRIAAITLLYICANPFLVDEAFRAWEPVTPDWDLMDTKYDAAIVLGGIGDVESPPTKNKFWHECRSTHANTAFVSYGTHQKNHLYWWLWQY